MCILDLILVISPTGGQAETSAKFIVKCDLSHITCSSKNEAPTCAVPECVRNSCADVLNNNTGVIECKLIETKGRCDCEYGFYRNSAGKCVTKDQC